MKAVCLVVVAAWAALSCAAAPVGVVSFSMKVAKSTEQPQKVITSDEMKNFREEADRLVHVIGDARSPVDGVTLSGTFFGIVKRYFTAVDEGKEPEDV